MFNKYTLLFIGRKSMLQAIKKIIPWWDVNRDKRYGR